MSEVHRQHERFMREALDLAAEAGEHNEVPIGCVIVRHGEVIGRGRNRVQEDADPTQHAEMVALHQAFRTVGEKVLDGAQVYVTVEPCAMCAGALVLAKVESVIYGTAEPKTGAARSVHELLDHPRLNHRCVVRSGVLEHEAAHLLQEFFQRRRVVPPAQGSADIEFASTTAIGEKANQKHAAGCLFLVPTPIGNVSDITKRALDTLAMADVVVCEDTRHTGQLLRHYGVRVQHLVSNHEHNEKQRANEIAMWVSEGKIVALVTDAGTPGMSDPGYRAVQMCVQHNLRVTALPGASAAVTALVASGLPTDSWYFAGFPPQKKGRTSFLQKLALRTETTVMYESPYRVVKLLQELLAVAGPERKIVVARELTKIHEEYVRGTLQSVVQHFEQRGSVKGECVIILNGFTESTTDNE